MATASAAAIGRSRERKLLPGILMGSSIAGILDLLLASLDTRLCTGFGPSVVWKAIASGLLGTHAFFRGTGTAFLGLVLQFFIAFAWATVFAAIATRWDIFVRRATLCGALYGVVVYAVMNWIVLPLSAYPKPPLAQQHVFWAYDFRARYPRLLIGMPIAFSVRYSIARADDM